MVQSRDARWAEADGGKSNIWTPAAQVLNAGNMNRLIAKI
jgi:hypothetical protein